MNREAKRIEADILARVTPTKEQRRALDDVAAALVERARAARGEGPLAFEPMIVGSLAKDTLVTTNLEIDLFLLFPPDLPRATLEEKGLQVGQAILDEHELRYAEHPYVHGAFRGTPVDVVPAYRVDATADRMTAVDRTPFHTRFVQERLRKRQRDPVRLLKQFMRGIGVYGAETTVGGFSGYLAELLVLHYGDFGRVLEAAAEWERGLVLHLTADRGPLFDAPLVVVDPVDPQRNAAAGVTREALELFRDAARAYRTRPRATFFFPHDPVPLPPADLLDRMRHKGTYFVGVELPRPEIREEALRPHLRKAARNLATHLGLEGFVVVEAHVHARPGDERVLLVFELAKGTLAATRVHHGPPEGFEARVREFREKWEGHARSRGKPYVEGGRWYVRVEREETQVEPILRTQLPRWHLGRYADEAVQQGARVLEPHELAESPAAAMVAELVTGLRPWER